MDKEKLYETLGELIYVIALADGVIQQEETDILNELLNTHKWAANIKWSFDYEVEHNNDPADIYKKVIYACHEYGPTPEYDEFIEVMQMVASASEGVDEHESEKINAFSKDLIDRFRKDTENIRS